MKLKRKGKQEPMKLCVEKTNINLALQMVDPQKFIAEFDKIRPGYALVAREDAVEIEFPDGGALELEGSDWVVFKADSSNDDYLSDADYKDKYRGIGNAGEKDKTIVLADEPIIPGGL